MPSIQSKAINVMLHLMRMKRTVNRMRQRVEIGERTYTEPSPRLHRKHQISKRELNGHLRRRSPAASMSSTCMAARTSTASPRSTGT
jgi:hypothetical protein